MRTKTVITYKLTITKAKVKSEELQAKLDDAFDYLFDEIFKELQMEDKQNSGLLGVN